MHNVVYKVCIVCYNKLMNTYQDPKTVAELITRLEAGELSTELNAVAAETIRFAYREAGWDPREAVLGAGD